ncbi:MAG TPA: SRPBCC family protein [bacterium]|nr:SRPBCC family protein [bacterium]HQG45841.1 SRPBCC family protein [bacterium]HQI50043.1 SRPBCC family protein [bacterium]HQJ65249.1 SRPBCC family protein [bacterium]
MVQIQVDQKAPAYAVREAYVNAPIQLVWNILANLEKWPEWNDSVKAMDLQGNVVPGTEFRWTAGGMKIRSRIEQVDPPRRIVWSGRTMGIRAMHSWTFAEEKEGTKVRTEESFEGWIVKLLARKMKRALSEALEQGISALKNEAEKRHREIMA